MTRVYKFQHPQCDWDRFPEYSYLSKTDGNTVSVDLKKLKSTTGKTSFFALPIIRRETISQKEGSAQTEKAVKETIVLEVPRKVEQEYLKSYAFVGLCLVRMNTQI